MSYNFNGGNLSIDSNGCLVVDVDDDAFSGRLSREQSVALAHLILNSVAPKKPEAASEQRETASDELGSVSPKKGTVFLYPSASVAPLIPLDDSALARACQRLECPIDGGKLVRSPNLRQGPGFGDILACACGFKVME